MEIVMVMEIDPLEAGGLNLQGVAVTGMAVILTSRHSTEAYPA